MLASKGGTGQQDDSEVRLRKVYRAPYCEVLGKLGAENGLAPKRFFPQPWSHWATLRKSESGAGVGSRVESVCWGGFRDIVFPRCTIMFQDLKDSSSWFCKMYHHYSRYQRFQNLIVQETLRFHTHRKLYKRIKRRIAFFQTYFRLTRIYLDSKIIQHVSGSRRF